MSRRLLVVDDDRAIRQSLSRALTLEGYEVADAPDGAAALTAIAEQPPDLVVLDLMMPNVDGLTVCRVLRAEGDRTPILVLTARVETADRVAGLDAGADDYLTKPFELDEMLARVRALLRRASPTTSDAVAHEARQTIGDLRVDVAGRRVWRHDDEVELTRTEFDLLELLVRNAGIVLEHATIYDRIWGYDFGPDSKNLAVYIGYLRRKLHRPGAAELIHTVRSVGYVLRSPDQAGDR